MDTCDWYFQCIILYTERCYKLVKKNSNQNIQTFKIKADDKLKRSYRKCQQKIYFDATVDASAIITKHAWPSSLPITCKRNSVLSGFTCKKYTQTLSYLIAGVTLGFGKLKVKILNFLVHVIDWSIGIEMQWTSPLVFWFVHLRWCFALFSFCFDDNIQRQLGLYAELTRVRKIKLTPDSLRTASVLYYGGLYMPCFETKTTGYGSVMNFT